MLQDEGRAQGGVTPDVQGRQDDPAVPLPTDQGPFVGDGPGHVGLAHRRPDKPRSALPGGVFHDQRRRKVRHHHRRLPRPPLPGEHRADGQGEGVVLADRRAGLIDQGEPVDIGVDRHAEVGPGPADQLREGAEIGRDRLGFPRETAIGFEVDPVDPGAEAFEEGQHGRGPRPAHTVEGDVELPLADPGNIEDRQREDGIEMTADRAAVAGHLADGVPPRARRALLGQTAHLGTGHGIEKDAIRTNELERVPFDRVVTGGEDQPRPGVVVLDGHLHRRRGHDAEIDHVNAHRQKAGDGGVAEHRPGRPGIAPQHHALAAPGTHPGTQRGRMTGDQLGGQVGANVSSQAGHGNHQGVRHAAAPNPVAIPVQAGGVRRPRERRS